MDLALARNKLTHVDLSEILAALPNLERLDLSQNLIVTLVKEPANTFTHANLKRLLLSRNLITDLRQMHRL